MVILHKDNNSNYSTLMTQPQYIQVTTLPTASVDNLGKVLQYIGADTSTLEHCHFYECVFNSPNYEWQEVNVSDNEIIQYAVVPVASANNVGRIIQYTGTTTSNYIKGYFYQSTEDSSTNPSTYSWVNVNVQAGGGGQTIQVTSLPTASSTNVGTVYQYIGATTQNYTHNYFYESILDNGTYKWVNTNVQNGSGGQTIQVAVLPTASADELNHIYQYIGTTGNGLVNGYFYKCVSDGESTPTYSWAVVDQPPTYPMWTGTVDEHTAAQTAGTIPNNSLVGITDNNGENITWYSRDDEGNETPFATGAVGAMIDDYHIATSTTWSSQKITNAIAAGTPVMQGASSIADGAAGFAPAPTTADTQKALFGDGQYHTVYTSAAGSTITVQTAESDLYGRTVTLTLGTATRTATISNSGEAVFTDVSYYGTAIVSADDGNGNEARGSVNLSYFGNYVVGLGFNFSTIKWETTNAALAGKQLSVCIGNREVGTVTPTLVAGTNIYRATMYVEQIATYKIQTIISEGHVRGSVDVNAMHQTYTSMVDIGEVYTYKISKNDSNPATMVTPYTDYEYGCDNALYTSVYMNFTTNSFNYGSWGALESCNRNNIFFAPKPCMLNYDGTVAYYLNPDDYTQKADGATASDVTDMTYNGNVMIEFPTIYFKRWEDNDYHYCVISNKAWDASFHAWAHHDKNGNILPHIYLSAYNGVYDGTKIRSISGCSHDGTLGNNKIVCMTTRQQEIDFAQANNTANERGEGWYIRHKAEWDMINDLLILISMNTDTQGKYGYGRAPSMAAATVPTGSMNDKGMFWGTTDTGYGVKIFGIENWWAGVWVALSGWIYDQGIQKVKMTYGQEDGSSTNGFNLDGNGYVTIPSSTVTGSNESVIRIWSSDEYGLIPKSTDGSTSTYLCDIVLYDNSSIRYMETGGGAESGGFKIGAFTLLPYNEVTRTYYAMSATLSYKGIAQSA